MTHRYDLELRGDVLRNLDQILFIVCRDQHRGDAAAKRSQKFFLEAANRQDPPAQCYLTGHGNIAAHRNPGQSRNDGGNDTDTG